MGVSYRFGPFELRPEARVLLKDGCETALGNRAFDMLVALVERRGRVVAKNELLDLAWPGLVVEENNLPVQIGNLRRVLGPTSIATIPGRGYRFDAQVEIDGAGADDRIETAGGPLPATELPLVASAIVGRDDDLAQLAALSETCAVVNIVGAGGIGKTRLARALTERLSQAMPGGVAWCDLADVDEPGFVATAIANALRLTLTPQVDPIELLCSELTKRPRVMIVLDNAEHVVESTGAAVSRISGAGPSLHIVVTSQVPLRISAERIYRLGPLAVPDSGCSAKEALGYGAVALFVERVVAVDRRFRFDDQQAEPVIEICRRLDGMPLALELAASRMPLLGSAGLREHLDSRFEVLTSGVRGAPSRQLTLRATFDWSHELLGSVERNVLRRLAVFRGGFSLPMARRLAADAEIDRWAVLEALGGLVDNSWVGVEGGTRPRYLLPESARSFALERLNAAGETDAMRLRHARLMVELMDSAYDDFWVLGDEAYVERYRPELENFRAAMEWAREREPETYVAMAASIVPLLRHLSLIREAFEVIDNARRLVTADVLLHTRARFAQSTAMLTSRLDDARRALELSREAGDPLLLCFALGRLAQLPTLPAEEQPVVLDEMRRLEETKWPPKVRVFAECAALGWQLRTGCYEDAWSGLTRRLAVCKDGGFTDAMTTQRMNGVIVLFCLGRTDDAITEALSVIDDCRRLDKPYRQAAMMANVFTIMLIQERERLVEAHRIASDFATLERGLGWVHAGDAVDGFALLAAVGGRLQDAAALLAFADTCFDESAARDPIAEAAHSRVLTLVEQALPVGSIATSRARGTQLTIDEAAALALGPAPVS
jgi:predicted ATPase/DNA-binding winged helix-turn-helix (wHTH) protein